MIGKKPIPLLAALLLLTACGLSDTPDGPAEAASEASPNIVFIYADDMRYDELAKVDRLRRMAGSGASFRRAYVTNSVCCPSRVTALTGRYSHSHGVLSNSGGTAPGGYGAYKARNLGAESLGVELKAVGYATFLGGKFLNAYGSKEPPEGFDAYFRTGSPAEDPRVGREAARFFASHREKPVFLTLWVKSPHSPLEASGRFRGSHSGEEIDPGPAYAEEDTSDKPPWVAKSKPPSPEEVDEKGSKRLAMLEGVAAAIARVQREVEERGEADNTFYVFASDNGYLFGEHNLSGKQLPYEESIRVPMALTGPGIEARESGELVTNNDIAPTVLDLAGAEAIGPTDGRSLVPLLKGENPDWRTAVLSENPGNFETPSHKMVRTDGYAYVEWGDGFEELYDTRSDPHQLDNLLHEPTPEAKAKAAELSVRLDALKGCAGESCRVAENTP